MNIKFSRKVKNSYNYTELCAGESDSTWSVIYECSSFVIDCVNQRMAGVALVVVTPHSVRMSFKQLLIVTFTSPVVVIPM